MEEAEKRQRESQEELDEITQQLSELQAKCSEFKARVQNQNAVLKTSEVSDQTVLAFFTIFMLHSFLKYWERF